MSSRSTKISNIKDLGSAIRKDRESQKLSQEKAAGLMGVSRKFLSELETGKKNTIQIGKIFQILHRLGFEMQLVSRGRR